MNRSNVLSGDRVVLASASVTRARLLSCAGVPFRAVTPQIDEEAVKNRLRSAGATPFETASSLAREKALAVAQSETDRIVVGSDQILDAEGEALDKPATVEEAASQLRRLSGRPHDQISCVCVVRDSEIAFESQGRATLHVRPLSDAFIAAYIDSVGVRALQGPGAYQLEGLGAQLFTRIDGDFFTVLGMPLLPLLAFLRKEGALLS